jgi:hypothetical protein
MSEIAKLEPVFRLASLGYQVYPCSRPDRGGKAPWCSGGFRDGTAEISLICRWAAEKPGCNWGVWPRDGVCVLDADAKHGGLAALASLEAKHGPLPATACCQSGGGGKHLYLSCPADFQAKAKLGCDGLELIAGKGGVIVPPSVHAETNKPYRWLAAPWDVPLAPAPAWLLAMAKNATVAGLPECQSQGLDLDTLACDTGEGPYFPDLGPLPEHERNEPLCQVIGRHFLRGESEAEVLGQALAWAEANGYDHAEMRRKVRSIARKEEAKASQQALPSLPYKVSVSVSEERSDSLFNLGREQTNSGAEAPDELVCSLPAWPRLSDKAYQGLLGTIVKAVSPETEADEVGVLLCLLCGFGNAVGRTAHVRVGARRHYANLFACLCGASSSAKGEAWGVVRYFLRQAEPAWAGACIAGGFGSGEGLAWRVRDDFTKQEPVKEQGSIVGYRPVIVPGASEKRALFVEAELTKAISLARQEKSTLSEMLRHAWDGEPLEYANKGDNAYRATEHHISILGMITPSALAHALGKGKGTEASDGTFSRFLWALVRSEKTLPYGGNVSVLDAFAVPLRQAIVKAKAVEEVRLSPETGALWESEQARLKHLCDSVPCTEKARPYVLRLALCYALADGRAEISLNHLEAALALWAYCEASARFLFKPDNKPLPLSVKSEEPLWLRLLKAISDKPGVSRTGLRDVAGHKMAAGELDAALSDLEGRGLAHQRECKPEGGGRPAECWFPGPGPSPPDGGGNSGEGNNSPPDCGGGGEETPGRELTPPAWEFAPRQPGEGTNSSSDPAELVPSPGLLPMPGPSQAEAGVSSLPPPELPPPEPGPSPTARHDGGKGEGLVVGPEDGLGLSGQADAVSQGKPLPKERWQELYPAPADRQAPALPERQPGESEGEHFLRCLE